MPWMSDEKYTYIQDCKEKKSVAASAFKARTHCGKGGRVKFPSDYLTRKELNAMNGECKSYRLNAPMSWDEFKSLPDDLKVVYIKGLREKYGVPDTKLIELWGITAYMFNKWIKCLGLRQGKSAGAAGRHWYKTDMHDKFVAWWNGVKLESNDISEETVDGSTDEDIKETVEHDYSLGVPDELIGKEIDTWPDGFEIPCAGPIQEVKSTGVSGSATDEAFIKYAEHVDRYCQAIDSKSTDDNGRCCTADPIMYAHNPIPVIPKSGAMSFENNWSDDILTTMKTLLSGVRVNMHISWEVVNIDEGEK